jgi:hypothetical protein
MCFFFLKKFLCIYSPIGFFVFLKNCSQLFIIIFAKRIEVLLEYKKINGFFDTFW